MKKLYIAIFVLFIGVLALPIIGNSFIEKTLNLKIERLESNGIKLKDTQDNSSYLQTSKHYEFIIEDTKKFLKYLNQYSEKQLTSYSTALLKGTVIGADFNYSNIPFFSNIVDVDIYPLTLSKEFLQNLKSNDESFEKFIKNFIAKKGIFYHINYNIETKKFNGYIKDIEENHTMENGSNLKVLVKNTQFKGDGNLIAPTSLQASSQQIELKISNSIEKLLVTLKDLSTTSTFNSQTTYLSSVKLKSFNMNTLNKQGQKVVLDILDMYMNLSLNTQNSKAEFNSKSSCSKLLLKSKYLNIEAQDFNYDIAIFDVDKDSLEKLRVLLFKSKTTKSLELSEKIADSSIELLSKGLNLTIADCSIKNIKIDDKDLNGFKLLSQLVIKKDPKLAKNIKQNPISILKDVNFDFKLKLSKKIYRTILSVAPNLIVAQQYAKDEGNNFIFNISLKDDKLKINDKIIGK
jgi:hypothetical protein